MSASTPQDPAQDAGGDTDDSRTRHSESGDPDVTNTSAQGSGKQFERGTESGADSDETTSAGPAAGPGASASGKRFARGTDSDGDGQTYDQS